MVDTENKKTNGRNWSQKVKDRSTAILGIIFAFAGLAIIFATWITQFFMDKKIVIEGEWALLSFSAGCFGLDMAKGMMKK